MQNMIVLTDGAGFSKISGDGNSIVVMQFSRKSVEACLTGDAVDRLMQLTDSKTNTLGFEDCLLFEFEGFDTDPREIPDIPECRKFFAAITEDWPYWMHFCIKMPETLNLVYSLLADVERVPGAPNQYRFRLDDVERVKAKLTRPIKALYEMYEIDDEHFQATMRRVALSTQWA